MDIRSARSTDVALIHPVIERAYRGDAARVGWTHEADLVDGTRTDLASLEAIVADPAQRLLIAWEGERPIGCVVVSYCGDTLAYLGQLCIDPLLQAGGRGRALISAAEDTARTVFAATRMEMTVIEQRVELIAWYARRGYLPTGERRDFPIALDPPFFMTVLEKRLGALATA